MYAVCECVPIEGQHLGAGNGACPLEEGLGVRCTILLPCELHTEREAVNHLKVAHPAPATTGVMHCQS